jgi:hypothetical protein
VIGFQRSENADHRSQNGLSVGTQGQPQRQPEAPLQDFNVMWLHSLSERDRSLAVGSTSPNDCLNPGTIIRDTYHWAPRPKRPGTTRSPSTPACSGNRSGEQAQGLIHFAAHCLSYLGPLDDRACISPKCFLVEGVYARDSSKDLASSPSTSAAAVLLQTVRTRLEARFQTCVH